MSQAKVAAVLLACIAVRFAISLGPHSGQGAPPMHGDYEAQRHWMEVTWHLPPIEWYRNSTANNLLYWGLDYPPLTAYWSWLMAAAAARTVPGLIEWEVSRGSAGETVRGGRAFMRFTVLIGDALVLVPAVLLFAHTAARLLRQRSPAVSGSLVLLCAMVWLLLHPALIIIDHGHFQYNNISCGLSLAAACALLNGSVLLAAATFAAALNYKQMTLYFAPVFFVYILAVCCSAPRPLAVLLPCVAASPQLVPPAKEADASAGLCSQTPASIARGADDARRGSGETLRQRGKHTCAVATPAVHAIDESCGSGGRATIAQLPRLWESLAAVLMVGGTVASVFAVLWAPFCFSHVLVQQLPEASADGAAESALLLPWSPQQCVGGMAAVLTRLFPFDRNLFEDKVSNIWCAAEPLLGLRRYLHAELLTATELARRRGLVAAACSAVTLVLAAPSLFLLFRQVTAAVRRAAGERYGASRLMASQVAPQLFASLFACAQAFFLASYQVHEKTVLLPALPLACLAVLRHSALQDSRAPLSASSPSLPAATAATQAVAASLLPLWYALLSTWSMWPLLAKDGLLMFAAALCGLYVASVLLLQFRMLFPTEKCAGVTTVAVAAHAAAPSLWLRGWDVALAEAAVLVRGWCRLCRCAGLPRLACCRVRRNGSWSPWALRATAAALVALLALSGVGITLISGAAWALQPPPSLPDMFPYLSAVLAACCLLAALVWATLLQAGMGEADPFDELLGVEHGSE